MSMIAGAMIGLGTVTALLAGTRNRVIGGLGVMLGGIALYVATEVMG